MAGLEFAHPWLLALLPLCALPYLPGQRDVMALPWVHWLPQDRAGPRVQRLWVGLGALTIALLVVGLSGPRSAPGLAERVGRGAEIAILLDRSASMDTPIRRKINMNYQEKQVTKTKNMLARESLGWLLAQRPENRYALTVFHVAAMRVTDFTDDVGIVRAGLDASGIGRGDRETNMGTALLTAIEAFDGRPYTGSRVLLLVSDGGAKLDRVTRERIGDGLQRNQIGLYFIHVKSGINDQNLALVGTDTDSQAEEVTLHLFFKSLGVPYQVFEAEDEASMAEAVAIIDEQQNAPLTYFEETAGVDYSRWLFTSAAAACIALTGLGLVRLETLE